MTLPVRVTMQDVARAAGVHQTTVSLALRNDSRLPEPTRERVRQIAERLGYRPDPMLAALNFYRASRHAAKAPPTMAFLVNFRDRQEMAGNHAHLAFLKGAQEQADQLGYRLEVFFVGHDAHEGRRLDRILRTRGITGVIAAAFADTLTGFELDWSQYSAVLIDSQQLRLSLHTVSNDQQAITRQAVQHLHAAGYRRIGLVSGLLEETNLRNAFTAGYYVETAQHRELVPVRPLILPVRRNEEIAQLVRDWVQAESVEVVISNLNNIADALRLAGVAVPEAVEVVTLDLCPTQGPRMGMRQNHRIVGQRAVEQLSVLMRSHQRGFVEAPNTTLINGAWVGSIAAPRPRAPRRENASPASARPINPSSHRLKRPSAPRPA